MKVLENNSDFHKAGKVLLDVIYGLTPNLSVAQWDWGNNSSVMPEI